MAKTISPNNAGCKLIKPADNSVAFNIRNTFLGMIYGNIKIALSAFL
jgi:hypothetical protein